YQGKCPVLALHQLGCKVMEITRAVKGHCRASSRRRRRGLQLSPEITHTAVCTPQTQFRCQRPQGNALCLSCREPAVHFRLRGDGTVQVQDAQAHPPPRSTRVSTWSSSTMERSISSREISRFGASVTTFLW